MGREDTEGIWLVPGPVSPVGPSPEGHRHSESDTRPHKVCVCVCIQVWYCSVYF